MAPAHETADLPLGKPRTDKGTAIAAAVRVDRSAALALEAEAMSWQVLDDLEEAGRW